MLMTTQVLDSTKNKTRLISIESQPKKVVVVVVVVVVMVTVVALVAKFCPSPSLAGLR